MKKEIEKEKNEVATPSKRGRKPKITEHYVNSEEFMNEIKLFYETDVITTPLGLMIAKIAEGLGKRPNFMNYTYLEEMVGDAKVKMFTALSDKNFDLNRGINPFSYFNRIAFHAFITRIDKEKKRRHALDLYQDEVYTEYMAEHGCHVDHQEMGFGSDDSESEHVEY